MTKRIVKKKTAKSSAKRKSLTTSKLKKMRGGARDPESGEYMKMMGFPPPPQP